MTLEEVTGGLPDIFATGDTAAPNGWVDNPVLCLAPAVIQ